MLNRFSFVTQRLVVVALFGSVLAVSATATAAGALTPVCANLTFENESSESFKVKQVVNGREVTRERVAPGDSVVVTVNSANEVWRVRRPSDAAKLWQGPSSCGDQRIVLGGAGSLDNDAPTLAINNIGILTSPVVISGTFNDQSDIDEVKAAVRAAGTKTYYRPDGSTASWHRLDLDGNNANGTADWSTPALDLPAGAYEIITRAIDEHGNRSPWLVNSFTVAGGGSSPCVVTFRNNTGQDYELRKLAGDGPNGVIATIGQADSFTVLAEEGDRYDAFQNFRTIWQWENTPNGVVPPGCTSRTVNVDGTCVDLVIANDSSESIKVKRLTPGGERTAAVLAAGATGTYEWSHSTEALVIRRPSNFSRIVSRNLGACGDVAVTVNADFSAPIEFG